MAKADYYEILGINKDASEAEIKSAFRKAAKQYHPDLHPGDAEAEKKFKEINEAYEVLSDPQKKAQYDQFGHAAFDPTQAQGGSFNGAGHTISGLYVFGVGETGLFGYINGATIENLIIGKGLVCSYDSNIGSVVGVFNGEGNVIRGCVNYANVTGNAYVGGIAGKYNSSSTARLTIENCANHGNVTATKKSNALYVGGIIPAVVGVQLKSCANFGTVSAGVVGDDSYAASGCAIIGGITGVMSGSGGDASIIECYNKGNVISCNSGANNGTSAAAGIVGRMNAANGAACTIKNCYSTGNVYTLTADSKELSASCSTKSGDDYAENVYASGKVLVWNTETENKNATVPACGAPEVSLGTGACDAMNLGTDAWSDASDNTPILKGIPAEHQISAS